MLVVWSNRRNALDLTPAHDEQENMTGSRDKLVGKKVLVVGGSSGSVISQLISDSGLTS